MAIASIVSDFSMHGARAAMAGGLSHIEEQVKGIERAVVENPGLAFDLAKTVVESACRTILTERKIAYGSDDDLPKLFKAVTTNLPLLPVAANGEASARKSLVQTLNGLHTALQGVCELRNAYGFASHGSDGQRPVMESVQALLAAQAADAIVGFLHRIHRGERQTSQQQRPGQSRTVDMLIDLIYESVVIAGQPYAVSEALYGTDLKAYFDIAAAVEESRNIRDDMSSKYQSFIRPEIEEVRFVHFDDRVYLKVIMQNGEINLEDTEFIAGVEDATQFFPSSHVPDKNADLLLTVFDPFSIINCFDLFTVEGAAKIAEAHYAGRLDDLFPITTKAPS